MPGLIGVVRKSPGQDLRRVFEILLAPMLRGGFQRESCVAADDQWAVGRFHLGILQGAPQLATSDSIQVLFHGELFNQKEVTNQLNVKSPIEPGDNISPLIKSLYRSHGIDFVSRLRGSFCAVVLDGTTKRLVLVSDRLGSYPLYWYSGPHRFVFASELKAVLRDPDVKAGLNPRAVADYLNFGFLFGDKTLASEVRLLPPASTLTYCWQNGGEVVESYSRLEEMFRPSERSYSQYLNEINVAFSDSVRRSTSGRHRLSLSLSGGLDSRAILSAIDCARTPLVTYTLGVKGCADEVIANELSKIAGTQHYFLELDTRYLTDGVANIRRMVRLADGMYLTHGLTEMLVLRFLEESNFSVLLRGHGGELAKASLAWPLHTDERVYGLQSADEFVSYILARVHYIRGDLPLNELFTDDWWTQLKGGARQSLEESIADVRLSPADLCSYLYLTQHHRRFTVASLDLFRNHVEVRMPFVDENFLQVLFQGPARWRDGTDIHQTIIRSNSPALLKVRNSNTGAPGDAGPFTEKLWDKVNSLFKRLNVYGYRHYHNFERWMKQSLVKSVEQVLLDPRCLDRGIYREAGLRRLIVW